MAVVEYTKSELTALGLKPKRRRLKPISKSKPLPIIWILGLTFLLTLFSLSIHQPVIIQGQTGSSASSIGQNGLTTQTVTTSDGRTITTKIQNFGWPTTYYVSSCYGLEPFCQNTSHLEWVALTANLTFWFIVICLARIAQVVTRKNVPARKRQKEKV